MGFPTLTVCATENHHKLKSETFFPLVDTNIHSCPCYSNEAPKNWIMHIRLAYKPILCLRCKKIHYIDLMERKSSRLMHWYVNKTVCTHSILTNVLM